MVNVNRDECIGCGLCTSLCSSVFEMDDEGKAKVKEDADTEKSADCIKEAVDQCPVGAISE